MKCPKCFSSETFIMGLSCSIIFSIIFYFVGYWEGRDDYYEKGILDGSAKFMSFNIDMDSSHKYGKNGDSIKSEYVL